ncbi:HoxN/HupN/NixA family nickel/cobalt transporter [Thermoflavimicrobium dichotomicum]|uniref:Nickel/cobalt efflux system n=1 Tax=Thermoflavimicrobium dichotomicum TaxID=46223 RepID=A0A1I3RPZ5_9BACL|nr:sodium:proton antiporter [Thermoflavimicrobium dichotomicum]SFJ47819.1 high-affinity nickel-transport protein [Thermoflavimicrobium dichotomicum]
MENLSLLFLVFTLGLRHGLDADHLACIDGLARYNWRKGSRIAPWVGTLFSFGHGLVVAIIGIILAHLSQNFQLPGYVDLFVEWFSILSLFLIGTLNIRNLLKTRQDEYRPQGIKGKLIPKKLQETSNPFLIILIGALFALASETVSQTSVWILAARNNADYLPYVLGLTFMVGMMITDTIDSLITNKILRQSNKLGQFASRVMGWIIVVLAYGLAFYKALTFFYPSAELDFEVIGIIIFVLFLFIFGWVTYLTRAGRSLPELSGSVGGTANHHGEK